MNHMRPIPVSRPRTLRRPQAPVTDWRVSLPAFVGRRVHLRELRPTDAPALLAAVSPEEVSRFITPQPGSVHAVERFITWARAERAAGRAACFAVTLPGSDEAIGMFQVRALEAGFATAEWGFVIGSAHWGRGLFIDAATLVVDFAFDVIGVRRLEARAAAANGRGNGALRKIGAVQEGVLRRAFVRDGRLLDQVLWSILCDEWREAKALWASARVAVH
jgi:ribosomal-protein-alanine N-acetyltransferase